MPGAGLAKAIARGRAGPQVVFMGTAAQQHEARGTIDAMSAVSFQNTVSLNITDF